MGHFIGYHPWWFLITPLVLSTSLGTGFYFLKGRTSNNIEEQFTPVDGKAKMERKYIEETFPGNDSMFSSLRLSTSGNYATLIATSDRNILRVGPLQEVVDLDLKVRTMVVQLDHQSFDYVNVCADVMGFCTSNVIIDIINHDANNIDSVNLTFPWYHSNSRSFPLYLSLGSVKWNKESSVIESAKAIQLHYYLRKDDKAKTNLWLESFIHLVSNNSSTSIQKTRVVDSVSDRLAGTYKEAAVSITITTLTDALALFLGYSSPFGSVRSFCLYAAISVCFCYLYSITFLGACMALNGQREAENKHWFTCAKIPEDVPCRNSKAFSICCVGGSYDRMTGKEETEPVSHFFKQFYGPFLTHRLTKAFIFIIYTGYLALSIYSCLKLKEGLDVRNLALDDSYIISYYNNQKQHFSEYSYSVMVAVKQPFPYWDKDEQKHLLSCISKFESLKFVNSTFAWFLAFQQYAKETNLNISSQKGFQTHLSHFLELNLMFRQDINFTSDNGIQASRFFIQTLNRTPVEDIMIGLREAAAECPVKLLVYHPAFIYFDQYTVIMNNTIQTLLVAVVVMLLVSLILIPNLLCSAWVAFAVCSVIVGVTGFMAQWGVSLDSISMINLVMCIGFSVDFSAHITYSFVSSTKRDANEKAIDALSHLGYPIVQGALSTILGVVVLSMSGSYIFRTFFKIVFLVILFGLIHGLVFIPVFLTLFEVCRK
ncbi:Patched domain-containing protein 3 RND-type protein RNDEu-3 [Channa argus]|uniref:Patched domain-containing protein 3 n=1 Tax=Channa argus TaxID=215402 RepID=A0A6G1Q953_CHAAH|nr:Patched domain-containing protein 3 RND-type protein RNDEu-3 [Channa argus]